MELPYVSLRSTSRSRSSIGSGNIAYSADNPTHPQKRIVSRNFTHAAARPCRAAMLADGGFRDRGTHSLEELACGGEDRHWGHRRRRRRRLREHRGVVAMGVAVGIAFVVAGLRPVLAASAGVSHTCAVLSDATVKCWGENLSGQLGHNDNVTRGTSREEMGDNLTAVPLGSDFEALSVHSGEYFNCAITIQHALKCWGINEFGQLGLGDNQTRGGVGDFVMGDSLQYVDLGAEELVESVDCGLYHSCAVLTGGKIKCWGSNEAGQLGLGDLRNRGSGPGEMGDSLDYVDLGTNVTAKTVVTGRRHTCALVTVSGVEGGVKCWGNNDGGQLGYEGVVSVGTTASTMGDNLMIVDLGREQTAVAIAAGAYHSCALLNTGQLKCWGYGEEGQLGQAISESVGLAVGSMGDNLAPIDLGTGRTAVAVDGGGSHTCAVLDNNSVKCWGNADRGTLGTGDTVGRGLNPGEMGDNLPAVNLTFGRGLGLVDNVFSGIYHTCVSGTKGGLACFGLNNFGQLGVGNDNNQGDEPDEVNLLDSIYLGKNVTVESPANPNADLVPVTISPTTAPSPAPMPVPTTVPMPPMAVDKTRTPVPGGTPAPSFLRNGDPGPPVQNTAGKDSESGGGSNSAFAGIVTAAVLVPLLLGCVLVGCCFYRRRQQQREMDKEPGRGVGRGAAGGAAIAGTDGIEHFVDPGSGASSDLNPEMNADGSVDVLAHKPLVKPHAIQSTAPLENTPSYAAGAIALQQSAAPGGGDSGGGPNAPRTMGPVTLADAGVVLPTGNGNRNSDNSSSSNGDMASNWARLGSSPPGSSVNLGAVGSLPDSSDTASENPSDLRRSSSGSSLSTLASTASTTSTAWTNEGFQTPARTDVPRGSGSIKHGGRSRGSSLSSSLLGTIGDGGVGGGGGGGPPSESGESSIGVGMRTPGSHLGAATPARLVPDTPSPTSHLSGAGTPHPPEMRLAHFARSNTVAGGGPGDNSLYGVPEMEINRSTSNVFDNSNDAGNRGWPAANAQQRGSSASAASAAVAAGAAAATTFNSSDGGASGDGDGVGTMMSSNSSSPRDDESPLPLHPIKTPTHTRERRHRSGNLNNGVTGAAVAAAAAAGSSLDNAGSGRKRSKFNRSNRTPGTTSPTALDSGGSGRETLVTERLGGWVKGEGGAFSAGGSGVDAVTQGFAEEAELEALQIDKNDLKLVFGRPFARGKTSEVYQVTHAGKNRAAKIIDLFLQGVVGDEVTRLYSCFAQELRTMKGIRHECVSSVYGAVATPSELTIVTDLVRRGSLRGVLDDRTKRDSLTSEIRHKIMKDMASGMAYLEKQGVQHRNLHSRNVLITKEWGAKVADYGLANTMEVLMCADGSGKASVDSSNSGTRGGNSKGSNWRSASLRWTAPELLRPSADGSDPYTTASDVYSMGIIVWEIVCGGPKLPWDGVPDEKVKSMILEGSTPPVPMEIPIAYSKLMYLCWRKNSSARPSFEHVAEVLLNEPPPAKAS